MNSSQQHGLSDLQAAESKLLVQTYERNPLLFVSGNGVYLCDEQGNDYLDLLSGIGVCALGYNHPIITDAIAEQSKKLLHTSNLFFHQHTAELALRLTEMTGLDRVFLCNSGTEASSLRVPMLASYGLRESRWEPSSLRSNTAFMDAPWALSPRLTNQSIANHLLP
jgi:acetylornithine/succinyldiaminopimelate/putrescine aminotransferase